MHCSSTCGVAENQVRQGLKVLQKIKGRDIDRLDDEKERDLWCEGKGEEKLDKFS